MKTFLRTAQHTIAMGLNAHMAHFTLEPWDIPTARNQTELTRFFAAPSAHSAVLHDGYMYYAVKPPILASILCFYGATLLGPGSCQDPNSNQTNDDAIDDDVDDDDVVVMARFLE